MPCDLPEAGCARDWLRHAQSDLELAGMPRKGRLLYEHLCFHAQQAAEKALKAVLVHRNIRIPRSHDLAYLMGMLPGDLCLPPSFIELPILTKHAVQQRYPGETRPLTAKDRRRALRLAQDAVSWATRSTRSP